MTPAATHSPAGLRRSPAVPVSASSSGAGRAGRPLSWAAGAFAYRIGVAP
jgi:hypothetical protein